MFLSSLVLLIRIMLVLLPDPLVFEVTDDFTLTPLYSALTSVLVFVSILIITFSYQVGFKNYSRFPYDLNQA
jgi:hypothetical protein